MPMLPLVDPTLRHDLLEFVDHLTKHIEDPRCPWGRYHKNTKATLDRLLSAAAGEPDGNELDDLVSSDQPTSSPYDSEKVKSQDTVINDDAYLSSNALATKFDVPANAMRQRLDRFRKSHDYGWMENADPKVREAKYLFHVKTVRPIIDELKRKNSG